MDTINKIISLLNENSRSQKELTDFLGIEKSVFSAWKNGNSKSYNKYISQIAEFFNVSTDYLVGNSIKFDFSVSEIDEAQIKCPVCNDECLNFNRVVSVDFENMKSSGAAIELCCSEGHVSYLILESIKGNTYLVLADEHCNLDYAPKIPYENAPVSLAELWNNEAPYQKKYASLDEYGKKAVDSILEIEYTRCASVSDEETVNFPTIEIKLSRLAASAGTGDYLDNEDYGHITVKKTEATMQADFAVRVNGDSMEPTYHDGDILLVEGAPYINVGDIGIFVVNGTGYVKEYGGDRLISHNEKYEDIMLHDYDVVMCSGRVIGVLED